MKLFINDNGKLYDQLKPPAAGSSNRWALWQPMKVYKFLWFQWVGRDISRTPFWLDDSDFYPAIKGEHY